MHERTPAERVLLLGRDHLEYGRYHSVKLAGGRTACAISVGSDSQAASLRSKGDPTVPNEDALMCIDEGERVLLAVADAHYGWEASHELLEGLAERCDRIPSTIEELQRIVESLASGEGDDVSASTLTIACFDRAQAEGFGISFGDSSLVVASPAATRRVSVQEPIFVTPRHPWTLSLDRQAPFRFSVPEGSLLLAFTDGIDECHYRSHRKSIQMRHLAELFAEVGERPAIYARRLMEMALKGVDGHPGGQDNIALIVCGASARVASDLRPGGRV